jgi:hypothetical protein
MELLYIWHKYEARRAGRVASQGTHWPHGLHLPPRGVQVSGRKTRSSRSIDFHSGRCIACSLPGGYRLTARPANQQSNDRATTLTACGPLLEHHRRILTLMQTIISVVRLSVSGCLPPVGFVWRDHCSVSRCLVCLVSMGSAYCLPSSSAWKVRWPCNCLVCVMVRCFGNSVTCWYVWWFGFLGNCVTYWFVWWLVVWENVWFVGSFDDLGFLGNCVTCGFVWWLGVWKNVWFVDLFDG